MRRAKHHYFEKCQAVYVLKAQQPGKEREHLKETLPRNVYPAKVAAKNNVPTCVADFEALYDAVERPAYRGKARSARAKQREYAECLEYVQKLTAVLVSFRLWLETRTGMFILGASIRQRAWEYAWTAGRPAFFAVARTYETVADLVMSAYQ